MSATFTSEGVIPHMQVVIGEAVILAPVKLETEPTNNGGHKLASSRRGNQNRHDPRPLRRNGKLVYALPGGLEVCP